MTLSEMNVFNALEKLMLNNILRILNNILHGTTTGCAETFDETSK